jgi:caffeoyl-CoA O-methyltransferase
VLRAHTPAGLAVLLDEVAGAFAVLITEPVPADLDAYEDVLWSRWNQVAQRCVGLVVASGDAAVRTRVLDTVGLVPYPLTALADRADAESWVRGQLAAGMRGRRPASGTRTVAMSPELECYITSCSSPAPPAAAATISRLTTERFADDAMNVGEDQGRFLGLLVALTRAINVVEVGTFTGMSTLWIASALPDTGRVTAFEIDPEPIEIAREAWVAAGVADRIDVVIGPAAEGLARLPNEPLIDLAFIDADKAGYRTYVELLLPRVRPGGLLVIDNTLWSGRVIDDRYQDESTAAIRAFNEWLVSRSDLGVTMLPIGDGVTIVETRR